MNYFKVIALTKADARLSGVIAVDQETGKSYTIKGKVVLNATGVFVDSIRRMDDAASQDTVCPSQGVHLVLDKEFLPGDYAILIPKTRDGRVLFAVPWYNKVLVGTTDVRKEKAELEPAALEEEVNFILETAGRFLVKSPKRKDVRSVFAGLRPLATPSGKSKKTKEISREHKILTSESGLVTLLGGKWTTYRRMGEEVIDKVAGIAHLPSRESITKDLRVHGYMEEVDFTSPFFYYGADASKIMALTQTVPEWKGFLSSNLSIIKAQVIWAVRFEMARTVEDILARRTRALFLDAKESIRMAPEVARLMALELGYDKKWEQQQVEGYKQLAKAYILT